MSIFSKFSSRKEEEKDYKISYSQCGEDLIISFIFGGLNIPQWTYLDVGAHHPTEINNTYLFYQRGHRGVCVEPDPILFAQLQKVRSEDTCLNVGIGVSEEVADFFVMSTRSLNTFSRVDAERYASNGPHQIEKVIPVQLVSINNIVEQYFNSGPNLVSLDIEGLDFEVLQTFDFKRFRPEVFCIETLTYTTDNTEQKKPEIVDWMNSHGYLSYADTYINTIFVRRDSWAAR